jgi:small subunit ribosomal protein S6
MPRTYEAVYIFDSALEDAAINDRLARFHGLLRISGEPSVEHWGRRQLAYKIGTKETGYYVVAKFDAESDGLAEYERALKLDEGVVRYLLSLHDRELGAPPMTEEELAAQRRREEEDEDEE